MTCLMVGLTPSHHSFLLGEKKVHIYSVSRGVVGCVCLRSLCVCVTLILCRWVYL